jgi:hypothetical protein
VSALADWLRDHGESYSRNNRLSLSKRRALRAIATCRTPTRGGQAYRCTQCGRTHLAFHSCHHRACPRCGGDRAASWSARQCERLLPVPYFMVTFTVPAPLRAAFLAQERVLIDVLFSQGAGALQDLASMPRHLGADLGMVGVLHTWGRQMQYHPHLHMIVPGGGLRADQRKWRRTRKPDWLLPSAALAARFRARFEQAMQAALPAWHAQIPDSCWKQPWVVNLRAVGRGEAAIKYLARYVSRSAISQQRIEHLGTHTVRFNYRDSQSGVKKSCTLSADEFMRRYLQHVLPSGIHRIRYYGWEHPAAHRRRRKVETLLAVRIVINTTAQPDPWHLRCPHCQDFTLVAVWTLWAPARAPPPLAA